MITIKKEIYPFFSLESDNIHPRLKRLNYINNLRHRILTVSRLIYESQTLLTSE